MNSEASSQLHDGLEALGKSGEANDYRYDKPNPDLLESFPAPTNQVGSELQIHIDVPEFTSLCPKTGQPDFATIIIDYVPDKRCVESKSLKLYLMGFRQHGEFHEACVQRICNDLVVLLDPIQLTVFGDFTPRGGIPFKPTASYYRPAPVEGGIRG